MTLPRTVADVLDRHVTFEIESIDRMYCNVYQPRLQYPKGAAAFFHFHRGHTFASSALMAPMTKAFVAEIHDFIAARGPDLVNFTKGQRKDDLTQSYLADHDGSEAVLYVGRAQEKASVMRTERRYDQRTGASYAWLVKASALVNHFYFYCFDDDFGRSSSSSAPTSLTTPSCASTATSGPNARPRRRGLGSPRWTTGSPPSTTRPRCRPSVIDSDPPRSTPCCASGSDGYRIHSPGWTALPDRYEISVLQAEFSLTQMLDKPITGRIFFEQVIRDNLDLGRPDQVGLVFARRIHAGRKQRTPGVFRTRVINSGVTPSLHVDYKHTTIKQYHKEGVALRTETTINDPGDFTINKGLTNLPAMRKVGFQANRRLLHVEHISHDPAAGAEAFTAVTESTSINGQHAAGLRFGDRRAQALLAVLLVFRLHPHGFTNADLRNHLTQMLGTDPRSWPAGRGTYDLRRLRLHGLIERIPHTHRYQVTETGLHHAMFLTRVHNRLIRTGEAQLADPQPPAPAPLRAAARAYDTALDQLVRQAGLAA